MNAVDHMKVYEEKINLRRFDEVEPLISPQAVFWFTDGTHRGIAEIRAAFERTWTTLQNEIYWLEDVEWIGLSDAVASCTYRFCWKAEISGDTFEGRGRGTTVLRTESGQWKIVHEHLSRFPD
ncbi:MAG TPA: nuclear transport factor 2 family protein [Methylocystis sp.]|nr:nuclear transport factor 2 family protein [Methylocystis sp.]